MSLTPAGFRIRPALLAIGIAAAIYLTISAFTGEGNAVGLSVAMLIALTCSVLAQLLVAVLRRRSNPD